MVFNKYTRIPNLIWDLIKDPDFRQDARRRTILHTLLAMTVLFLSACAGQPPSSPHLEGVRAQREALLVSQLNASRFGYGWPAFIRVFKEEAVMEVWLAHPDTGVYDLYREYPICKFSGTLGPKIAEGDGQAPEGFYTVRARQMNPWSGHHLSFNLGYPNEYDKMLGRTGNLLMIHGGCKSIGCFAVTDEAIEDIYLITEASIKAEHNVPVHIFPFRMSPENMLRHAGSEWMPFWENLKQGYDYFESRRIPPTIGVDPALRRYYLQENPLNFIMY